MIEILGDWRSAPLLEVQFVCLEGYVQLSDELITLDAASQLSVYYSLKQAFSGRHGIQHY